MPGTIKDPRMNPVGERAFGTVFNHDDSHSYVYIKNDDDSETDYEGSRFFVEGTRVELDQIFPAFLVVPTLSEEQLLEYKNLDFKGKGNSILKFLKEKGRQLKEDLVKCEEFGMCVEDDWKDEPVIFDLIKISKAPNTSEKQPVIDELNKKAKEKLKKNQ